MKSIDNLKRARSAGFKLLIILLITLLRMGCHLGQMFWFSSQNSCYFAPRRTVLVYRYTKANPQDFDERKIGLFGSFPPPYGGVSVHIERLSGNIIKDGYIYIKD